MINKLEEYMHIIRAVDIQIWYDKGVELASDGNI